MSITEDLLVGYSIPQAIVSITEHLLGGDSIPQAIVSITLEPCYNTPPGSHSLPTVK